MLNPDEQKALDTLFAYHAANEQQVDKMKDIRQSGKLFAALIVGTCPRSADRSAALRHIRDAVMSANASIVLPQTPNVL